MNLLYIIDIIGTMVFAISGALTAADKKLDFFGIAAVGFVTAIGGGTIRDILIGSTPVGWMLDLSYILIIGIGIIMALVFSRHIQNLRRTFFLFDTIGISVFTVLGLQKALGIGIDPFISTMMGMVSAVFGGVIRDIICNEIPLIFRKEIYALTCLSGGILYVALRALDIMQFWNVLITVAFIVTFRLLAVRFNWQLNGQHESDSNN
ncbi:MAG: trimeric intracellular cation channel family protein [Cytophagales bacterium]|nr:trimeric intracellular cation channel family protein [Cytophagales bacterium]